MKQLLSLFIAGVLLAGNAATAQTAAEIVTKHYEAMGGDAWKTVTSIKMTGTVSASGMDIPLTLTKVRDKGMRQDLDIMGTKCFIITTPAAGWMYIPMQSPRVEPLTPDMLAASQSQLSLTDELMDYAARGAKVAYAGKETIDGKEQYKLTLTDKENKEKTLYLDAATYYITRSTQKVTTEGKEVQAVSNQGDYKKLPEGIVLPMTMSSEMGSMTISKVEVNIVTDDGIFKPEAGKG